MSHWLLYLITRIDSLKATLYALSAISWIALVLFIIASIGIFLVYCSGNTKDKDGIITFMREVRTYISVKKLAICLVCSTILFHTSYLALPSLKQVAVIYTVPKLLNNEEVAKLPDNIARLFNAKAEAWIEEVTNLK